MVKDSSGGRKGTGTGLCPAAVLVVAAVAAVDTAVVKESTGGRRASRTRRHEGIDVERSRIQKTGFSYDD